MKDIVDSVHNLFLEEAKQSPLLFSDLANVEKYIAESYSGRSLIELLQNADDAEATKFFLGKISSNVFIVANNGRVFTSEDMLALCRSGASNKRRKSNTIGYRGIGFKSIVNYADTVHLYSGDIRATFSRELTQKCLLDAFDVPLIRLPHHLSADMYIHEINALVDSGFSTIFVLEVHNSTLENEIQCFSIDCMLFLRSIRTIVFKVSEEITYSIFRKPLENGFVAADISDKDNNVEQWLIRSSLANGCDGSAIAFKYNGQRAVKAEASESVVHSFMPTYSTLSMRLKINGDFSTDPSRTRIVMDDASNIACKSCAEVLRQIFHEIWESKADSYGLLNIIKDAKTDPLSSVRGKGPNDVIVDLLKGSTRDELSFHKLSCSDIVLQPQGFDNEDFLKVCNELSLLGIGNKEENLIPGLLEFLKAMGVPILGTNDVLRAMQHIRCSEQTCISALVRVINESHTGISNTTREGIRNAVLFKTEEGLKSIEQFQPEEQIDSVFEGAITESLVSGADYTSFARKIGLDQHHLSMNNSLDVAVPASKSLDEVTKTVLKHPPIMHPWRTAELNCAAVLESLDSVVQIVDVSKQNMGYDLEAIMKDGSKTYYEVKNVSRLGDSISISNNEYSTGMLYGNHYYLAIVCQTESEINVCLVQNPINNLLLDKRITRWDWICEQYSGKILKATIK